MSFGTQYTYRKNSISLIYHKNFLSAVITVLIFQYINLSYLMMADRRVLKLFKDQERKEYEMALLVLKFHKKLYLGIFTSASCLVQVFSLFLFNAFSDFNLPFDPWAMVDILNAVVNICVFITLITIEPKSWLDPKYASTITSLFVVMLIVSWTRFLLFMTLIKKFSILLITMIKMVQDSKTFFALMGMMMFVFMVYFMTLFQEVSIHYNNPLMTFRTMFDAMLGNFSHYSNKTNDSYWEHYFAIILYVVISHVFLLNYLIAIMSTTYEEMMPKGNFSFQSQRYKYIERFSIAMKDQWGYEELVVHPPPLNCLVLILVPSLFKP